MKQNSDFLNNPGRQRLLDQILDARTLTEIAVATQKLEEWVRRYPEDVGIREAFEGLSLMRDIAEEQEAERAQELVASASLQNSSVK